MPMVDVLKRVVVLAKAEIPWIIVKRAGGGH
jgi:hypothetical protein